jgi:phage baseplate assembly protein W
MRIQSNTDVSTNYKKSTVIARDSTYSDLDLLFAPNPVTGDVNPVKDIEALKRSVKNLVLTNFNERPFQPEIGSGIRNLLFEPADPITIHDLEQTIIRTITNFEPRVQVLNVEVIDNSDSNEYTINVEFQILANEQVGSTTLILERLR